MVRRQPGSTSLAVINGTGSSWLAKVVYLPAYPEISAPDFERLVELTAAIAQGAEEVAFSGQLPAFFAL